GFSSRWLGEDTPAARLPSPANDPPDPPGAASRRGACRGGAARGGGSPLGDTIGQVSPLAGSGRTRLRRASRRQRTTPWTPRSPLRAECLVGESPPAAGLPSATPLARFL